MKLWIDSLNNRELASLIWLVAFLGWSLRSRDVRKSLICLVRSLAHPSLMACLGMFGVQIVISVVVLRFLGVWNAGLLKDTIVAGFAVGFSIFIHLGDATKDPQFFRRTIWSALSATILVEFVVNLYSFPFLVELLTLPLVGLLVIVQVMAGTKSEWKIVVKPVGCLIAIYGFSALAYSVVAALREPAVALGVGSLESIILAPVFTFSLLPVAYLWALWALYETIFVRIRFATKDPVLVKYARVRILGRFRFRLKPLIAWSQRAGYLRFDSRREVNERLVSVPCFTTSPLLDN